MTPSIPNAKPYYTPKEVAAIMGLHPETVRLWVRIGKLRAHKVGSRCVRIPATAIFKAGAVPSEQFLN